MRKNTNYVHQEDDASDLRLFTVKTIDCVHAGAIHISMQINGTPVCMELDTGASVSLVSEKSGESN